MIVNDIIDDAGQVLGFCDKTLIYSRLNKAIEVLSNKGNWDPLMAYMDIASVSGNILTLPPDVEIPIRININNNPSFSRDRLYEFTMNGPGSDMADSGGFSWMDKGRVPVLVQPPIPSHLILFPVNSSDEGGICIVSGRDENQLPVTDSIVLAANEGASTATSHKYSRIEHVVLPDHDFNLTLKTITESSVVLSNYTPSEIEPNYRQVLLTQTGAAVRVLFRRTRYDISSDTDFIPLHSEMAIILMVKALEKMRNEDFDNAQKLQDKAVEFIKDEQQSLSGYDLNKDTQSPSALDISYLNIDSIIVGDVYDDFAQMAGPTGRTHVYDDITDAVTALSNKGTWDGMEGYVDIVVQGSHYVTLPRYVDSVLTINVGGCPMQIRNRWFEFHLNGPGSECRHSCRFVDDRGEVVTLAEPTFSQQLVAIPDLAMDNGTPVRVYGTYQGKEVYFNDGPNGAMQEGIPVTCNTAMILPATNAPFIDIITRVTKGTSKGFIRLHGYSADRNKMNLLGFYYPDETEPKYRRIKLSQPCGWIRLRYRKRTRKVSSLTDPLHLRSKIALVTMGRALAALAKGDLANSQAMDAQATAFLNEEQSAHNTTDTFSFSYDKRVHMADPLQGII